jgi:hypothetical protein
MPSIAEQDATQLGGRWSVLVRQKRDHEHLDRLLEHLSGATGDRRDALLHDVYRLVFPHAFAEESVLWPAVRRTLPEGEALTLRIEEEHQEVNELVTGLQDPELPEHERGRRIERLVRLCGRTSGTRRTSCSPGCSRSSPPGSYGHWGSRGRPSAAPRRPVRTRWSPAARPATCSPPCP